MSKRHWALFFNSLRGIITDDEIKVFAFSKVPLLKAKPTKATKAIVSKLDNFLNLDLGRYKGGQVFPSCCERVLSNREFRLFLEILIMGRVPQQDIVEYAEDRFRFNYSFEIEDLREYTHWFFDSALMDDIHWQNHIMCLDAMTSVEGDDKIWETEKSDKLFAMRNNANYVLLRAGVKIRSLGYPEMCDLLIGRIFDSAIEDWDKGVEWRQVLSKIKLLSEMGVSRVTYQSKSEDDNDSDQHPFEEWEDAEVEIIHERLEELPVLDDLRDLENIPEDEENGE